MVNKYLEKELKENISHNEVFERLTHQDLEKVKETFNQSVLSNILIEFDSKKINNSKLLNMYPFDSQENYQIWDRLVAIKILKAFNEKSYSDTSYLDEQEEFIYNTDINEYWELISFNSNAGIGNSNVKLMFAMVNMGMRVHFVIEGCSNKSLYNAVSSYLDDSLPIAMIYCDDTFICKVKQEEYFEKQWLWNIYDYKLFDGFNNGMDSSKMRNKKVLPDKPKGLVRKMDKYEKI